MAVNPLLATLGCASIIALRGEEGRQMVSRAKSLLKNSIRKVTASMMQASFSDSDDSESEGKFICDILFNSCTNYTDC